MNNPFRMSLYLNPTFSVIIFIFLFIRLAAQTEYVIVDSIMIAGNSKTHRHVILREIDIKQNDTIPLHQLSYRLNINEKRLLSAGLFTLVNLNIKNWNTESGHCHLAISVNENWYIYPYPILELADRNFNVWKDEHNYDIKRLNYGLALQHINLTGNKDKLKVKFQRGYTHKYEIKYEYPYLKDKWGTVANYLYSSNREIIYKTSGNKPQFLRHPDEKKIFSQHRLNIGLTHRTNAKTNQFFGVEYFAGNVDKYISQEKNPDFFGQGRSSLQFVSLDYLISYDNTIYPLYPLGGYSAEFILRKEGIGIGDNINNLWASLSIENHLPIFKKVVLSTKIKGKYNFQSDPLPYFLNSAIGYNRDMITGYQLYVMDGREYGVFSNALKFSIIDQNFTFDNKYLPQQFRKMNLKFFLRFNLDYGYARDPEFGEENSFSNKLNYGFGPALDMILFNNFTLSCQYGITSFGEKGIFFQSDVNF